VHYGQLFGFFHQFYFYGIAYSDYSLGLHVRLFKSVLRLGLGLVLGLGVGFALLLNRLTQLRLRLVVRLVAVIAVC